MNEPLTEHDHIASSPRTWSNPVALVVVALLLIAAALSGFWLGLQWNAPPGDRSAEAGFTRDLMAHHAQASINEPAAPVSAAQE